MGFRLQDLADRSGWMSRRSLTDHQKNLERRQRWANYLADFHTERAGITSEVLSRSTAGPGNPYRWLARAVSSSATRVLDVACASGQMTLELAKESRTVFGVDISEAELVKAAERSAGPWIRADAMALPFSDDSFDAVTSMMGFAVIHPVGDLVKEIVRVLKPGGVVAGVLPSIPIRGDDAAFQAKLAVMLRARPRFSGARDLALMPLLEAYGLRKVENGRERYRYLISSRPDAVTFISSLYLPNASPERVAKAVDWLAGQVVKKGPFTVPVTMRRVVAIK